MKSTVLGYAPHAGIKADSVLTSDVMLIWSLQEAHKINIAMYNNQFLRHKLEIIHIWEAE